ncbi:GNAT family N-acetyltransferase [Shouchella sp. JSM 1781072]|uniref:GNAT family N-acetyltransferase n=1 Tax=Shouchella sp. JSM 1781072 TaxID=3344581 RepID=UPI0035BF39F1
MTESDLYVKIADENNEFEQIYQLNYQTFVEEIPQHLPNSQEKLIDRFNSENVYIIAKIDEDVIGMICVREKRPFSLDQKLDCLDDVVDLTGKPCEIRLLAICEKYRRGTIFYRLVYELVSYCLAQQYTIALISGTTRQIHLYKKMGFLPFGPLVGHRDAQFQPMFLNEENFSKKSLVYKRIIKRHERSSYTKQSFLPGPVSIPNDVQEAFTAEPISHRDPQFVTLMKQVKHGLLRRTNAKHVQIAMGTGTMANEMIAAQLSILGGKGLILACGEFGERLIAQGTRWGLNFDTIEHEDWSSISITQIQRRLEQIGPIKWLWTVHCETSTGYLFPIEGLTMLCDQYNFRLCLDACSSLGTLPINLANVYLASSVSGKGLASYPGLALLFHQESIEPSKHLPAYLDAGYYQKNEGVPFTYSSNLILALEQALTHHHCSENLYKRLLKKLCEEKIDVLKHETYSPAILSIKLPKDLPSKKVGDSLKKASIIVSYESHYLLNRNVIQLALMGSMKEKNVLTVVEILIKTFQTLRKQASTL